MLEKLQQLAYYWSFYAEQGHWQDLVIALIVLGLALGVAGVLIFTMWKSVSGGASFAKFVWEKLLYSDLAREVKRVLLSDQSRVVPFPGGYTGVGVSSKARVHLHPNKMDLIYVKNLPTEFEGRDLTLIIGAAKKKKAQHESALLRESARTKKEAEARLAQSLRGDDSHEDFPKCSSGLVAHGDDGKGDTQERTVVGTEVKTTERPVEEIWVRKEDWNNLSDKWQQAVKALEEAREGNKMLERQRQELEAQIESWRKAVDNRASQIESWRKAVDNRDTEVSQLKERLCAAADGRIRYIQGTGWVDVTQGDPYVSDKEMLRSLKVECDDQKRTITLLETTKKRLTEMLDKAFYGKVRPDQRRGWVEVSEEDITVHGAPSCPGQESGEVRWVVHGGDDRMFWLWDGTAWVNVEAAVFCGSEVWKDGQHRYWNKKRGCWYTTPNGERSYAKVGRWPIDLVELVNSLDRAIGMVSKEGALAALKAVQNIRASVMEVVARTKPAQDKDDHQGVQDPYTKGELAASRVNGN